MSHSDPRSAEQNVKLTTLKAALNGDGDALDEVITNVALLGQQSIQEEYYKAVAPGSTSSPTYEEIDSVVFTIEPGDYWIDITAICGGTMLNRTYSVLLSINGVPVGDMVWNPFASNDDRCITVLEEVLGLTGPNLTVSIEASASSDSVAVLQWACRIRKQEDE